MQAQAAAIEMAGLSKQFGWHRAVDSLNLAVRPGSVFGFLGPNGAGKTTTIRVQGHLDQRWSAWFAGLAISYDTDDNTRLCGPLVDEAALHGVLIKVRDLTLPLLEIHQVAADTPEGTPTPHHTRTHTRGDDEAEQ